MSTVLYKSDYLTIEYYPEDKIIISVWGVSSLDFTIDDFYKEAIQYSKAVEGKEVRGILIDTRKFNFPMTEEVNHWVAENITPSFIKSGVKKVAYIMPEDFISRLGVELLVDKVNEKGEIVRRFFADFEEGLEWLKK